MPGQYRQTKGGTKSEEVISIAREVPEYLAGKAQLTYRGRSGVFDGGSTIARFTRENGAVFELFFANPSYWSNEAKTASKAPVAILAEDAPDRLRLVEVKVGSSLETRICRLLAEAISSKRNSREMTLELIEIRDGILTRVPLASMSRNFDPANGWRVRPEAR